MFTIRAGNSLDQIRLQDLPGHASSSAELGRRHPLTTQSSIAARSCVVDRHERGNCTAQVASGRLLPLHAAHVRRLQDEYNRLYPTSSLTVLKHMRCINACWLVVCEMKYHLPQTGRRRAQTAALACATAAAWKEPVRQPMQALSHSCALQSASSMMRRTCVVSQHRLGGTKFIGGDERSGARTTSIFAPQPSLVNEG